MRLDPKAFTCERTLPLPVLASMLLNLHKGTLQDKLDQHAKVLSVRDRLRGIAASAFFQARRKLAPMAVRALREPAVMYFCKRFAAKHWQGLRLLRVDGSTLHLPATADVVAEFGPPAKRLDDPLGVAGAFLRCARPSRRRWRSGWHERGPLRTRREDLAATDAQDLLLYNRGYPASRLFALHQLERRAFRLRMPLGFSKEVEAYVASGGPQCGGDLHLLRRDPSPMRVLRTAEHTAATPPRAGRAQGVADRLHQARRRAYRVNVVNALSKPRVPRDRGDRYECGPRR